MSYGQPKEDHLIRNVILGAVGALLVIALFFGIGTATKAFERYQARADATNQVEVNSIIIRQQEQRVLIEQQDAQVRIEEAKGIAEAQRIIDASLTDQYLTYLAIEAQRQMADSPNHSTVYIPSGPNGIPLVKEVE